MTEWTDEMKATAAGMKRAGLPSKTIAARLGVTEKAVRCMTSKLGARQKLDGKGGGRGSFLYKPINHKSPPSRFVESDE